MSEAQKPISQPPSAAPTLVVSTGGENGHYTIVVALMAGNTPVVGAKGIAFGVVDDPATPVEFVTGPSGYATFKLDFSARWRSGFFLVNGIKEDFRLSGPSTAPRPPDVPKKYQRNPVLKWGFRFGTDNNVRCLTFWLLAVVCLAVNIWLSTSSPAADPLVEANRRAAAFIKGESESFFSFSIPFRWKVWAWWLVFCIVYTPIALSDEAAWAWEAAKRKILEDRGGKETAPTPKVTASSSTTTTTAAPANAGGEKHLTWRDYVRWEFIISLVTIFFEKMVSGAFRRKET